MRLRKGKIITLLVAEFLLLSHTGSTISAAQKAKRPFTVADDIGLIQFADVEAEPRIKYSPDGRHFAVVTKQSSLDRSERDDTLWLFRTEDVRTDLEQPGRATARTPLARMSADKTEVIIQGVRWLPDSSGIAFIAVKQSERCRFKQLFLVDIRTKTVQPLTPDDQNVDEFDIRSHSAFVYTVSAPQLLKGLPTQEVTVLTGKVMFNSPALFPEHSLQQLTPFNETGLWMVLDGKRSLVLDAQAYSGMWGSSLSLSPDASWAVAILNTDHPPADWARYKSSPAYKDKPLDPVAYYLIGLKKGTKKLLFDAPCGLGGKWWIRIPEIARWSADGRSLLLSNTFFPLDISDAKERTERERHPNMAVLRLDTGRLSAVLPVKGGYDEHGKHVKGRYTISDLRFTDNHTVVVDYDRSWIDPDGPPSAVFYEGVDGAWKQVPGAEDPLLASLPIKVEVREAINQPPRILAATKASEDFHVIWDLNPQLKDIELGEAEVIHGTDANGYEWEAGLVKPLGYEPGTRYPLVIQTHGFGKKQFLSNGSYTTAFAARAMAAAGIMVVQVSGNPRHYTTPLEGPDQVALYRSIVNMLSDKGLVDPKRVGAIGFSRTGYHVFFAMTVPSLLAAASTTDVSTFGYFEYVFSVDREPVSSLEKIYGGSPFDEVGMKKWSALCPLFNMSKTKTPLLLVQPGIVAVLFDLEPYAALRYLHKPVDLIMIPSDSHVMSNPRQRFLSETLNVDWFRFWLQDYEDPDPAKAEQYTRWRDLRKMQAENEKKSATPQAASN